MNLTKFQIAAVKQTAKALKPLENKLAAIDKKRTEVLAKFVEQESEVHTEINSIHELIKNISGGLTLEEILTPEQVAITETPIIGDVDEFPVEMVKVKTDNHIPNNCDLIFEEAAKRDITFEGWAKKAVANAING